MQPLKRIEDTVKKWSLNEYLENTILGIIAFFLATFIHEMGHVIVANLLGCKAGLTHSGLITGITSIGECSNYKLQIIALAGPLASFLTGIFIWFSESENSKLRLLAIILFLLSSVIQLVPVKPLDGYQAIEFGMAVWLELLIFISILSVSVNLILDEVKT